jgi:eukaryotic-like serine/threonine-protein kinase
MRPSQVLDARYRLEERIAAGGVGRVWRGTDLLLRRPVAVKLLRPEYADHPDTLGRFRAEARHAGALTHPCIARVYDYCDGGPDASPYLVMELVDGPSLADILDTGTIGAARAMDIIAQAAAGLAAAHGTGLVHRDIKPANILLSPDGLVKITDFGIAHAAGAAPVTDPEMVMGTAQYLAPERITGRHYDPASDLYSLGIVLYECLAGQPPFDGTSAEVMSAHLYAPLPPLPSGMPPAIRELLARLTAKDPAARLSDAAELATVAGQLSAALAAAPSEPSVEPAGMAEPDRPAEPVPAGEPGKSTQEDARPARSKRRRILAMSTATAAVAALSGGLLASGALRITTMPGHAPPGPPAHLATLPNATAPGTQPGATPSGQPVKPNANPSPSPGPGSNAGPGRNDSPSQDARSARRTGKSTTAAPTPTATSTSGSTSSGGGIQLQLGGIGISLGL